MIIGLTLKDSLTSSDQVILIIVTDKISTEISKIHRDDLFDNNNPNTPINQLPQTEKTSRIPFIATCHQKLSGFQSTLHYRYQEMINDYP